MTPAVQNPDELKRRILFTPLESKEALHDWIELFLGIDLPDSLVDETSNSTPLSALWEVYDRCRRNEEEGFRRILAYASRMSFKTLCASILEVLMIFHLRRSVAHMAAIEGQAKKSQEYVKKFLRRPLLRDFVVGSNQRRVEVVRYFDPQTGVSLSIKQWSALPTDVEKNRYEQVSNYIAIVICTMAGANSEHVPFFVVDEVDVVSNPAAYQEAKAIPDVFEDLLPVTLLTSTRKVSTGLVQKEINNAETSGLEIRHWNILDVTQRCPEKRHRPDLPRLKIYRSDETLRAISEDDYKLLDPKQQQFYVGQEGYAGCLQNCKLFAVCKGKLATHQKSESKLLKKIVQTQAQFAEFSPEMAKAQLLCWKPSTEGLIYPRLDPTVHYLTAAQIAEKITGEEYSPKFTKAQLLDLLKTREVSWYAGMDPGFVHNFATVVGVRDGDNMFIVDSISYNDMELGEMMEVFEARLKPHDPTIFPDMARVDLLKTLRKHGFKVRKWDKGKGSVLGGIETVRLKLWPAVGKPQLYFLAEDEGVAFLFQRLQEYAWKIDAAGTITEEPTKENDDECDALRYLVMNVFAPKGHVVSARAEERNPLALPPPGPPTPSQIRQTHWNQLMAHAGMMVEDPNVPQAPGEGAPQGARSGKKGRLVWDLG